MIVHEPPAADNRKTTWSLAGWIGSVLVAVLCGAASLAVLCAISGRSPLMHDEHQFITPGILTLRDGLLPYKDYPLFHVPYQPILNAAFLQFAGGDIFLGCRLPGAIAAWITAMLLGWQGFLWFRPRLEHLGLAIAAAVAFAVCVTPVTLRACSFAWNHQWPTLLTIASVLLIFRLEKRNRWVVALVAGVFIGIAAGMRISFLPMLAPLGLSVLLLPQRTWGDRIRMASSFSAGVILALLPCLWLFAKAPEDFLFGNFQYPKFSIPRKELPFWSDKTERRVDPVLGYVGSEKVFKAKPLSDKLGHAKNQFVRPNAAILALALVCGVGGAAWAIWRRPDQRYRALVLLGGVPFLIWGSLAPSRFHQQYWYSPVPWLALLALFGLSQLPSSRWSKVAIVAFTAMVAGSAAYAARFYPRLFSGPTSAFFAVSPNLRPQPEFVDYPQPVLTLHPTRYSAVGATIYPELNSGEFGWRCAHLLPKDRRLRLKLLSPYDLEEILSQRLPGTIVVGGPEPKMEEPLVRWAEERGYRTGKHPHVYFAPPRVESPQPTAGQSSSSSAE